MLAAYKKRGLKMILLFNVHAMFDGHDFVYVKTLPEEKMMTSNPLVDGWFRSDNLDKIVANNSTLVDYIIKNGYTDTVAYWEMDNERWDMPGKEYAACVAAHIKMLRKKLPHAKVIVCLGDLASYSRSPERDHYVTWTGMCSPVCGMRASLTRSTTSLRISTLISSTGRRDCPYPA